MRGKLILIAGAAAGYVLGARAGRSRYDQIAKAAGKLWESPTVQRQVNTVEEFAKDKAPAVVGFLGGSVKKAAGKSGKKGAGSGSASGSTGSGAGLQGDSSSTTPPSV